MTTVLDTESIHLRIAELPPGGTAFHAWLHPGVSPPDRGSHADMLAGGSMDVSPPYFQGLADSVDRGVHVRQLRVLPEPGEFGYDDRDIEVMRRQASEIAAATKAPIRTVDFTLFSKLLSSAHGVNPDLAERYIASIESDNPESSFWSIRTIRGAGEIALDYLGIITYKDDKFVGRRVVKRPIAPDVQAYEQFCQGVYHAYGEEVKPA